MYCVDLVELNVPMRCGSVRKKIRQDAMSRLTLLRRQAERERRRWQPWQILSRYALSYVMKLNECPGATESTCNYVHRQSGQRAQICSAQAFPCSIGLEPYADRLHALGALVDAPATAFPRRR